MSTHAPSAAGTAPIDPRVDAHAYAAAVRSHLDDLPADVQEELAGGLDADLAERAAESGVPLGHVLGDPATYAAELRASAGLPPRMARRSGLQASLAQELSTARAQWQEVRRVLDATGWWRPLRGGLVSLRPAWWLARAWVAYHLLGSVVGSPGEGLPGGLGELVLYVALAAGSVALGRGWLAGRQPVLALVAAGNVLAVLVLPFALDRTDSGATRTEVIYDSGPGWGLVLDGEPVANLFPYDAEGRPLTGVQLLDDRGRPVEIGPDVREFPVGDEGWLTLVPTTGASGDQLWNVYPLRESRATGPDARPGPGSRVAPAPLPVPTLPRLDRGTTGTVPAPSATGTPTDPPTAQPGEVPVPEPTAAPLSPSPLSPAPPSPAPPSPTP